MYKIPVIQKSIYDDGEFQKILELNNLGGNILPVTDISAQQSNNTTNFFIDGGIDKQSLILQNNYNPFEEENKTFQQHNQNIQNEPILRKSISTLENELSMYSNMNNILDPRIRQQIENDSIENKTNLFFNESQDFVREVRDSYGAALREEFLYRPDMFNRYLNTPLKNDFIMNDGQQALATGALASGQQALAAMTLANGLANGQQTQQAKLTKPIETITPTIAGSKIKFFKKENIF
jgi:hypothetical protein